LIWIEEDQVQRMDEADFLHLHFPSIPSVTQGCYDGRVYTDDPPAVQAENYRQQNPNFPRDIDDDEIVKRYIPARFPRTVSMESYALSWIPQSGEIIQDTQQRDLLQRIWDGRQKHVIDQTSFAEDGLFCEYAYWIDFENKVMQVEGVVEGTLVVHFKDMKVGILENIKDYDWKQAKLSGDLEDAMAQIGQKASPQDETQVC
jgi:hypothetical protein